MTSSKSMHSASYIDFVGIPTLKFPNVGMTTDRLWPIVLQKVAYYAALLPVLSNYDKNYAKVHKLCCRFQNYAHKMTTFLCI